MEQRFGLTFANGLWAIRFAAILRTENLKCSVLPFSY